VLGNILQRGYVVPQLSNPFMGSAADGGIAVLPGISVHPRPWCRAGLTVLIGVCCRRGLNAGQRSAIRPAIDLAR
jgi:hypothetical protein